MLHENVTFYVKVIYPIEAHYITRQIFSVFVEQRTVYEFLGLITACPNGGQWAPSAKIAQPPWLKPLVTPLNTGGDTCCKQTLLIKDRLTFQNDQFF